MYIDQLGMDKKFIDIDLEGTMAMPLPPAPVEDGGQREHDKQIWMQSLLVFDIPTMGYLILRKIIWRVYKLDEEHVDRQRIDLSYLMCMNCDNDELN